MTVSYFWNWINYYQIQQIVHKNFVVENWFLMVSAIKEFISENWKRQSCEDCFSWKKDLWFIRIASFFKIWHDLSRPENFLIESCRGFSYLQFKFLFRQIDQLELEIYSKTSEQLWKLKKKSNIDISKTLP